VVEHNIKVKLLHLSNFVKPVYQVILMVFTLSLLLFLSYFRMRQFYIVDQSPGVQVVSEKEKGEIPVIDVGFYLRNFLDFDVTNNEFQIDAYVWFEYDKEKIKFEDIDDFSFGKASIESKSKPYMSDVGGKRVVGYDVKVKFPSNLSYKYFPIDSHRLYLTLNNFSLRYKKVAYNISPKTFIVADTIYTKGWKNIGTDVKSGFKTLYLDKDNAERAVTFPRILFVMDFLGLSFRTFMLIMLPLLVIFFISLFTLSLDPKKYYIAILSVAAATMTALISYRFVIESMSPSVSYFMLSDHFFDLILVLNFIVFLVGTVLLKRFVKYRGLLVVCFHCILIIAWIYLLFVWAH
jgi:hypothetical protein